MKTLFTLLTTVCLASTAFGQATDYVANVQVRTADQDIENWQNVQNWKEGQVPTAEETVIILSNHSQEEASYPMVSANRSVNGSKVHPATKSSVVKDAPAHSQYIP